MSIISIRLPEKLLQELDMRAEICKMPRAEYIRHAIALMNQEMIKKESRKRLMKASLRVRKDSMKINAEFSRIDDEPKD